MSSRQDWRTPPSLFAQLSRDFGPFVLDAAADDENHLCERYFTVETDGLRSCWYGRVFVNVPFGEPLPWVVKALAELASGNCERVCLIGVANITAEWFHLAMSKGTLYVPDKRIAYWHPEEPPGSMDRDTCIIVMEGGAGWSIKPYTIPNLGAEIRRLCSEANGQRALFGAA